jgi:hypothetical protein
MSQKIYRRVGDEHDPVTGCRRVRLERKTQTGFRLYGSPGTTVRTRYLDGGGTVVTTAGEHRSETAMPFEPIPDHTHNVLDLDRLRLAAAALAKSMAAQDGPATLEQVATWVRSYQGLLDWQKAAEARLVESQGQITSVRALLARSVPVGIRRCTPAAG